MPTLQEKVLDLAVSQLGVQEDPKNSNWGPRVGDYLRAAGYISPEPWCMSFCYWCTAHACIDLGISNPLARTGGCHDQWNKRPAMQVKTPQPGDIGIIFESETAGHAFLVEKIVGDTVNTIEGNSNTDGSSEGYEVVRHNRPISHIHGFLRLC